MTTRSDGRSMQGSAASAGRHLNFEPMQILVINAGSTSLKFDVLSLKSDAGAHPAERLAGGRIVGIGRATEFQAMIGGASQKMDRPQLRDHAAAAQFALDWLLKYRGLRTRDFDGIAHRIVHGGPHRFEPTLIDNDVLREVSAARDFAPLHNDPALSAIEVARRCLPGAPMVAVFDTAFFHDLPAPALLYAIPRSTADRYGIRRYGFHGIAHRCMAERGVKLLGEGNARRIVTLQLGGGCSAAAIRDGRPVDTTMGLTPLEGLVMATRSGDIDPSIVRMLARYQSKSPEEIDRWLNQACGLLGVSGVSADMRELLELEASGHEGASLAIEMFCHRVRKCIGAYMSVLGGADAIIFGGGIGEHSPEVRARICRGMEWCGLIISDRANSEAIGREQRISADSSIVGAFVIPVDESPLIAADAARCLRDLTQGVDASSCSPQEGERKS